MCQYSWPIAGRWQNALQTASAGLTSLDPTLLFATPSRNIVPISTVCHSTQEHCFALLVQQSHFDGRAESTTLQPISQVISGTQHTVHLIADASSNLPHLVNYWESRQGPSLLTIQEEPAQLDSFEAELQSFLQGGMQFGAPGSRDI